METLIVIFLIIYLLLDKTNLIDIIRDRRTKWK